MAEEAEPEVWVVAGCLFEVSLPEEGDIPWQWRDPVPEVTPLGETLRRGQRHFRFRAEAAGATAGEVTLRFGRTVEHAVVVRAVIVGIAPEADPE